MSTGGENALAIAGRLAALGVHVRSAELQAEAKRIEQFYTRGGNRAMRRAAARRVRRKA